MSEEQCQYCIWWLGDGRGEQGECTNGDGLTKTLTGRYENCMDYLARDLNIDNLDIEVDPLDFD